jgi:hypothetical protein
MNDAINEIIGRCEGSAMMFEIIEKIKEILLEKNEIEESAHDSMVKAEEEKKEPGARVGAEDDIEMVKSDVWTELTDEIFVEWATAK